MRKDSPTLMEEIVGGPIRHMVSAPSLLMAGEPKTRHVLLTSLEDQRHPGKPDAKIHSSTRRIDPLALEERASQRDQHPPGNTANSINTDKYGSVASRGSSRAAGSSSNGHKHTPNRIPSNATSSSSSTPHGNPNPTKMSQFDEIHIPPEVFPGRTPSDDYVTGIPLFCLMAGLMLAIFLISIDRTIISTAIPYITSAFHSTPDIGWYGSSYLLTACAFQPVFGRIFMLFDVKKAYLLAMFLFELGSLICGVAHSSMALIVGRAIAGFGCAGMLTGSFVVVATAVPLHVRPVFMAVVGVM